MYKKIKLCNLTMVEGVSPMNVYRFRSIDALLDKYQELERQSIYFASPEELNDPMEGFRDIVWHGDKIVWTNLFKHYVFCMHESYFLLRKTRDSRKLSVDDIPISNRWDKIPTPEKQRLFDDVWHRFFKLPYMVEIIEAIANRSRNIRYRELGYYFRVIQSILLVEIEDLYIVHGFMCESERTQLPEGLPGVQTMCASIRASIAQFDQAKTEDELNAMLLETEARDNDERIKHQLKNPITSKNLRNNSQLMHLDFPNTYLREIERLLWPKWYIACFMKDYRNSSVWGHYGNEHRGVCLIFETVNTCESNGLKFNKVKGKSEGTMPFHEVSYADKPGEVDFFQSIGRLSVPELIKLWYTDSEGNRSECASHIRPDGNKKEDWQDTYWKKFYCDITTKTKDWAYEQECRLILGKEIRRQRVHREEIRTRTYDFNSLKGIIFGIKTSDEDKLRIIKIIQEKRKQHKRTDFKFYQAYYSQKAGDIRKYEIQLT